MLCTSAILAHCSSSVSLLPISHEANPHCGLRHKRSKGYEYHVVKAMVTNFHQPKSTLLLLVSALIGDNWHRVYDYALSHDFRFLSYGDSSLLIP